MPIDESRMDIISHDLTMLLLGRDPELDTMNIAKKYAKIYEEVSVWVFNDIYGGIVEDAYEEVVEIPED